VPNHIQANKSYIKIETKTTTTLFCFFTPPHGSPQVSGRPGQRLSRARGREGRPERVVGGGEEEAGGTAKVTWRGRPRGRGVQWQKSCECDGEFS
jgi:hypothetical protein